jgi:hypothetical protein
VSGPARTAVAAAALTTVRRRGDSESALADGEEALSDVELALSDDLYRLVTGDQITDQYDERAGEPVKFARSSTEGRFRP